jgi:type VI protein secretion system component Hcp
MKRFLILVSVTILMTSTSAFAAVDYYVNTGSSVNCTTAQGQSGFEILSFSLGGMDTVTIGGATGGAGGVSKPKLSNLVVTKQFDACSEPLIKQFLLGSVIPTVTLTGVRSGGETEVPIPILTITLTNARIDNWQMSGSEENPTESVSFAYAQVCVAYTPISPTGVPGQPTKVCYNSTTNKVM